MVPPRDGLPVPGPLQEQRIVRTGVEMNEGAMKLQHGRDPEESRRLPAAILILALCLMLAGTASLAYVCLARNTIRLGQYRIRGPAWRSLFDEVGYDDPNGGTLWYFYEGRTWTLVRPVVDFPSFRVYRVERSPVPPPQLFH
jgi:hypothetical protein